MRRPRFVEAAVERRRVERCEVALHAREDVCSLHARGNPTADNTARCDVLGTEIALIDADQVEERELVAKILQ